MALHSKGGNVMQDFTWFGIMNISKKQRTVFLKTNTIRASYSTTDILLEYNYNNHLHPWVLVNLKGQILGTNIQNVQNTFVMQDCNIAVSIVHDIAYGREIPNMPHICHI